MGVSGFYVFKIDSGLFQFDFTDHHAVLGVPIDADGYPQTLSQYRPTSAP